MNVPIYSATQMAVNSAITSAAALNSNIIVRHGDVVFHGPMALVLTIVAVIAGTIFFALVIATLIAIIKEM